jgi:asparagine synthase (glutamine-hydrolysing)
MSEGTDLIYARKVAKHIGSTHTEVMFTPQEGLAVIDDVIYTLESWDTTSIRASVPQYMVCRDVGTKTDAKAVMIGEGADEVCSSYLFNWYAPNGDELHNAAKEYVGENHCYDIKRADRCISRWGLEGRPSLYDTEFIEAYWSIPAEYRMPTYKGIEKWWLRAAFQKDTDLLLPQEVLMRKKEAFSDGVSASKSWYQMIQDFVEDKVSDEELKWATFVYPYCTPTTKEAYFYRSIFNKYYPQVSAAQTVRKWIPKWQENQDPSGRANAAHVQADVEIAK